MILFFSGCGNSRFVAEQLASLTGDSLCQINPAETEPSVSLSDGEALGIVCPVYAWAVPRLVRDYIVRLSAKCKPSYCYLACTCGDNVGRTPEKLEKTMCSKGWHLDAAFSFVMPETYINLPGFSLDTREKENGKIAAVRQRLPYVAEKIKQRAKVIDVVRGKMPRFNTYVMNALFYGAVITDRKFRVTDDCISCGLCEKVCPLHNVKIVDGHPKWFGNCTNCMACYHHCPKNAIHFGKATIGKGQYVFPNKP